MSHPHRLYRLLAFVLVASMLVSPAQMPTTQAAPAAPVMVAQFTTSGLYRTHVTVDSSARRARLDALAVTVLAEGQGWAIVLADADQLEALARLRFEPQASDDLAALTAAAGPARAWLTEGLRPLLAQAEAVQQQRAMVETAGAAAPTAVTALRAAMKAVTPEQAAGITALTSVDDDGDGLTNTQEQWWCTDPMNPDSDGDGTSDFAEVATLKNWMGNRRAGPPSSGKPFAGWPPQTTSAGNPGRTFACQDDDRDSVPDLAERWELGLNMNRESSDKDKFDDGQELFGYTNCPGGDASCGYGDLPRSSDTGYVGAAMPSWVKAPGNYPLVAAFPVPEVDVVESSLKVQTVTEVTTDHVISKGTEKSYSTAKTEGTSTSVANAVTWNNWQEQSIATTMPLASSSSLRPQDETWDKVKVAGAVAIGIAGGAAAITCVVATLGACGLVGALAAGVAGGAGVGMAYGDVVVNKKESVQQQQTMQQIQNDIKKLKEMQSTCKAPNLANYAALAEATSAGDQQANPQGIDGALSCAGNTGPLAKSQSPNREQPVTGTQDRSYGDRRLTGNTSDSRAFSEQYYQLQYPLSQPTQTTTNTSGRSWGGAQTTTTEKYEEHTITEGEAFSNEEAWGNATAQDSAHAADLWFTYKVRNTGTEYAREIGDLAFNVYLGDDPNPIYTYFVGPDLGGDGKFHNFMPGEEHTYTAHHIALTLEQMKAIEVNPFCKEWRLMGRIPPFDPVKPETRCPGSDLRIVVEDFTYGADELFYQDAANAGVLLAMEDGTDDGDEAIDSYLIPTWGDETVLDVLGRYFPHTTDENGMMVAIWTPEQQRTDTPAWCVEPQAIGIGSQRTLWCKHALSTADWWNVYTDGMGDGSEGFQDTPAAAGQTALFRFNQDSDLDGYSDRSEEKLGTLPNDPASYPRPELIAGLYTIRGGNNVTATLSLLNTGVYDAYGVEAVMIAPDDTTSITNNTVGGSGRVRAQKQIIVGSRIAAQSPLPAAWLAQGHAQPVAGGYYTGDADRTYAFTVAGCGDSLGCPITSTWTLSWNDGRGATGSLAFDNAYKSPTLRSVGAFGLQLGFRSGKVLNGESFTVAATTPRDTFQYTIAAGHETDFTPPIVIVSYNDPQGNHRFVTPINLTLPTDNLIAHAGKMLHGGAGVEIVTSAPFTPTQTNTTDLVVQAPPAARMLGAHVFLEFIDPNGTVVREEAVTTDLEPGPNLISITWNPADFNPAYDPAQDYIVMAFFTDYQGNIVGTAGRPLSSFQADPKPALAYDAASTTWDFGSVAQGTALSHTFTLANTGLMDLKATVVGTGARADQAVPGLITWTDTGLDIAIGDGLGIRATGTVCYATGGTTSCYGSDGDGTPAGAGWTLPGASAASLIARIGAGAPFYVGSTYVAAASATGRLYLGANDCTGCYGDNGGSYQAHIEIQGLPTGFGKSPSLSVSPAGIINLDVALDTYYLPIGAFDRSVTVRTSDPAHPTLTIRVQGTVQAYASPAQALAISPYRPWDQKVAVSGDRTSRDLVTFDDVIAADETAVQPLWVYNDKRQIRLGSGKLVARETVSGNLITSVAAAETSAGEADLPVAVSKTPAAGPATQPNAVAGLEEMFGDGRDGVMPASGNLDYNNGFGLGIAWGSQGSYLINVTDAASVWRVQPGDVVLIHQTQGSGAGCWELNKAVSDFGGGTATYQLAKPLQCNYSNGGNNHAQIQRVPQYTDCPVSGTVTPLYGWNGSSGGILAVMCNGTMNLTGSMYSVGYGFRGGFGSNQAAGRTGQAGESYPGLGIFCTARLCFVQRQNNGGGGGSGGEIYGGSGAGAGAGYGTVGLPGKYGDTVPGQVHGYADLSTAFLGSGGGGGFENGGGQAGGSGAAGGGIIFVSARQLNASGIINASGGNAEIKTRTYLGGGGSGGAIKIVAGTVSLGTNIRSFGGLGGIEPADPGYDGDCGGDGGVGRIRVEYCDSISGSTNPAANAQKLTCYGTITGKVWSDNNSSGGQDAGEPNMPNVTVTLSGVGAATTASDGTYSFANVVPGSYTVSVTPPAGYIAVTAGNVGVNVTSNSANTVNFGLLPRASISGKVFHDTDNNGSQGAGEAGVNGVTLTLNTGATGTTDANGAYTFADLMPGSYSVSVSVPDGYISTTATTVPVTLIAGQGGGTAHFGILMYAVEKVSAHGNRFFMPETFRGGRRYWVQYGRSLTFAGAGDGVATVKLPKAHYSAASLDVLITSAGATFIQANLDVGNNGSYEWGYNANTTPPKLLSVANLAAGLNAFMATATPDANGLVAVPIRLNLNTSGQVYLTNLVATPDGVSDVSIVAADVGLNPATVIEGETVDVQATLRNSSPFGSGGLVVSFQATPPGGTGVTPWYIGSAFVPDVPAGGAYTASLAWNTLGFTGAVPVHVTIDPANSVAETNETNNAITATVAIRTRPDLSLDPITLSDDEPVAGEAVTVTLPLHNNGQTTAAAQTVALYDGNPDAGGTLVETLHATSLQGGAKSPVTFTWTPATPGPHRLFARADRDRQVAESDEGNNDRWQDVNVGFRGPLLLDSGTVAADPTYTTTLGYGVVDEKQLDVTGNCGAAPYQTYRRDPGGRVAYRFDNLLPGHYYHLDLTLYECDRAGRQEVVKVDGGQVAGPIDLGNALSHTLSLRLDPALYADRTISVTVEAAPMNGAVVSEIALHDVDYRYADSGGAADATYTPERSWGYLEPTSVTISGTLPAYSARVNQDAPELRYRFDRLDPAKQYQVHLTFYHTLGASVVQKAQFDSADAGPSFNLTSGQVYSTSLRVPPTAYAADGSLVVGIVRLGASSGAFVNEVALEEETVATAAAGCTVVQTPYFTEAYGQVTANAAAAPPGTLIQAISPRGDTVGCFTVQNSGAYVLRIYGQDTTASPPIPGMREGELVEFRVNGAPTVATPSLYWHDDKAARLINLAAGPVEGQSILLTPPWTLISFNLEPAVPLVPRVLGSIADRYDRVLGETGVSAPSLPVTYTTLSELHAGQAYWVRITGSSSANLLVQGLAVPPTATLALHAGWNWVGYLPETTLPLTTALASISGSVLRVIGDRGSYQPDLLPQYITLWDLRPGEGYLIRTNKAVSLTYPSGAVSQSAGELTGLPASACPPVARTPFLSLVYGPVMADGQPAPVGARVDAVTPRGEIAGCTTVTTAGYFGAMALYGEDASASPRIPGFQRGEPVTFRINGRPAIAGPTLTWQDDLETHQVKLQAAANWQIYLPVITQER